MDGFVIFLGVVVLGFVVWILISSRRRQAKRMEESAEEEAGLSTVRDLFEAETGYHAPLADFHVHGEEARVIFDVPLPAEDDPVLNDLLIDEAVEVVRQKRHSLPIDDVAYIVVLAGRGEPREVGRSQLPAIGVLPPAAERLGLSFTKIAHDPFATSFDEDETDHVVTYDTKSDVPPDQLTPLFEELKIPRGLDRGLRATGVDPAVMSGPDFVLALLRMFGYGVSERPLPGSYMALKDGVSTFILTDAYQSGDHPELEESVVRRFLGDFDSSGADRGMMLTDKYSPFLIHQIEINQPKVRFITRERVQRFIDSMALG